MRRLFIFCAQLACLAMLVASVTAGNQRVCERRDGSIHIGFSCACTECAVDQQAVFCSGNCRGTDSGDLSLAGRCCSCDVLDTFNATVTAQIAVPQPEMDMVAELVRTSFTFMLPPEVGYLHLKVAQPNLRSMATVQLLI